MYKDKDKQRIANRERQRRYKLKQKGVTLEGVTEKALPGFIGSESDGAEFKDCRALPVSFGQPDCECRHCQNNRRNGNRKIINHGQHKSFSELGKHELNRVSLPGDVDYKGKMVG